ncbi:hypothetical protein JCM33374_g3547 [Metschnikowia sp. JCM 33374]|nr:hypothetical protein JCM33374_g3547 [Metschnikowia sp. JCM 33374]
MSILAILKARGLLRDEMSILGDSLNGIQVNGGNAQDSVTAAETSEVQVSGEVSGIVPVLISSEVIRRIGFL